VPAVVSRLVQLVADYGPGDLAYAELTQRVALAVPDSVVQLTRVAHADTLAAGFCVARLALTDGPPGRIVAHDVRPATGTHDPRMCTGRAPGEAWIVGRNAGWSWSFVVDELAALCHLDVTTGGAQPGPCDGLPVAIAHVARRHPHARWDAVPRSSFQPVPERVVAFVDAAGDITTTISDPPGAAGARVEVRIGRISARAIVTAAGHSIAAGDLALISGAPAWSTRDGSRRSFVGLTVGGGSAAERFAIPPSGTPVGLSAAGA
jgi:hypothetical protein